jgi:branched-chain amino acid transport system permease protein
MTLELPQLVMILLNGLVLAANLFIVSAGKSIVYGVSRTSNFAHGSFFMLGAFIGYSLVQAFPAGTGWFFLACALSALAVGCLGLLVETTIFRRIYNAPHHLQLIATFGLFLVLRDLTLVIWGPYELLGPRVPAFSGTVRILGRRFPEYNFVILAAAVLLLLLLWLLFTRTRWGLLLRAATQDREMVAALGVDQKWLFTGVFLLGAVLAGLAGALQIPRRPAALGMDLDIVIQAFAVIVIGGMGSIAGTFVASILVGLIQTLGAVFMSEISLVLIFVLMAATLVVRPNGLMGKHLGHDWADPVASETVIRRAKGRERLIWLGLSVALTLLPVLGGSFLLGVASETMIYALFAFSFYLMGGPAGMMSFGQAAFFAVGMYTAAMLMRDLGVGLGWALIAGPAAAAFCAAVFGFFYVRAAGIRLAMLSLAFGQLIWAVLYQWYGVTNGDNGILNIWPPEWAAGRVSYFYICLALCAAGILAMRHIVFTPFGYSLRAGRDSPLRAGATGIDVARQRWIGFVVSGVFGGLSGVLMVYLKGSAFPAYADVTSSFDALVMALLGGLQSLSGPVFGAVIYRLVKIGLQMEFTRWPIAMGLVLILIAVFMPRGVTGLVEALRGWWQRQTVARRAAAPVAATTAGMGGKP